MSISAQELADPELLASEWDLAPLVDREGDDGARRLLEEAAVRSEAFAAAHAGRVAELDADGLSEAMRELAADLELRGQRRLLRVTAILNGHGGPGPGRPARARAGAVDHDLDEPVVLRA